MSIVIVLIVYYLCRGLLVVHPLRLLLLPLILLWLGIMGMGCGIILSSLTTKYRDLSVLVGFGMSLWMYGTPVVYPLSMLTGTLRQLIILNPVTMPVELFRWAILGTGTLDVRYIITSLFFTAIVFLLGVVMFNRVYCLNLTTQSLPPQRGSCMPIVTSYHVRPSFLVENFYSSGYDILSSRRTAQAAFLL